MKHMDYTQGCVNLRDVGEFVNLIAGRPLLLEGRLYRGGKLDYVTAAADINSPRTIINLRNSPDAKTFGAICRHFPLSSNFDKYQTQQPEIRNWLQNILKVFEAPDLAFPVLIHCNTGKDRTGVVVAALLKIAGVPDEVTVAEYLLSDGDVREIWIRQALDGFSDMARYFRRVDLELVRMRITNRA